MTNYSFQYGQYQMGHVYQWISVANHSCLPNASAVAGHPGTLRALRDIAEGEEVTIMYTNGNLRFRCRCEECTRRSQSRLRDRLRSSEGSGGVVSLFAGRSRSRRRRNSTEGSSTISETPSTNEAGSSSQQTQNQQSREENVEDQQQQGSNQEEGQRPSETVRASVWRFFGWRD